MKKFTRVLIILGSILGILALSIFIAYLMLYFSSEEIKYCITKELSDNIGDFLNGTVGMILMFVSTVFLFITFFFQREQFKRTESDAYRGRFEGTFFNMLSMLDNVRNESNKQLELFAEEGINSLGSLYFKFKDYYKKRKNDSKDFSLSMKTFHADNLVKTQIETSIYDLGKAYDDFIDQSKCNPSFYFRYLYNLINFVIEHWAKSPEEIHKYLNFIQAQLSDEELCLLFYDSISNKGLDKKRSYTFKETLDRYSFLENIPADALLDRNHYKIFPNTLFQFLNNDERKKVIKDENKTTH